MYVGEKHNRSLLDLYLLGIVLYQIGTIIRLVLSFQLGGNVLRIIGVGITLYSVAHVLIFYKQRLLKYPFLFKFLFIWNILNVVGSICFTGLNLTRTFGEDVYILNFLLPFLMLYDYRTLNFKKLFNYCVLFVVFALVLIVVNFNYILHANSISYIISLMEETKQNIGQLPILWSIPAAMIFMNLDLFRNKKIFICILGFILSIAFSMAFGRRSTSFYGAVFLLVGYVLFMKNPRYRINQKVLVSFLLIGVAVVLVVYSLSHFSFIVERGLEDTRSSVANAFYEDMTTIDYIFGRGINGTYYDPMIIFADINYQRPVHETGYLNILLHAGALFLIPYLLIGLSAFYKGFYKSNSIFVKSFAIYIIVNDLLLIFGSYPSFSIRFFILWIGILICNDKYIRSLNNVQIKAYINLR